MKKYISVIFLLLSMSVISWGAGVSLDSLIANSSKGQDASLRFLSLIFGSINGMLPASNVMIVPLMIKFFNYGLIAYLSLIVAYSVSTSVIKTASQGKLLGKQGGGVAAMFRTVAATSALTPISIYGGFSLMQIIMIKIIISGVGLANSVWSNVTSYVNEKGSILSQQIESNKNKVKDFKWAENGMEYLNTFVFCVAYNDAIRSKFGIHSPLRNGYFIGQKDKQIQLYSDYNAHPFVPCGILSIKFGVDSEILGFDNNVVTAVTNYISAIKSTADLVLAKYPSTGIVEKTPNQYEYINASRDLMIDTVARSLLKKDLPVPGLDWGGGWIYAGSMFNQLMSKDLKATSLAKKELKITYFNSMVFQYNPIFPDFNQVISKPKVPVNKSKKINDDEDIYLKSILSIIPISPENYGLFLLEPGLAIPKKSAEVEKTIAILDFFNTAEARGQKTLSGGMSFSGLLKSFISASGWNFGMFFSADFDDSKGPLNIVERDRVLTRDIQILIFKIYDAWLKIIPDKYRIDNNPISRIRDFGLQLSSAGLEFFINLTQDTFYASMGASLTAMSESMSYMLKGLTAKAAAGFLSYLTTGFWQGTYIPIVGQIIFLPLWLATTAGQAASQGISSYYMMMSSIPNLYVPLVVASRLMYLSLATAAAIPPIVLGLLFAIYIPFVPFMVFLFSAIGWLITVVESVLAAPIVAAGIAKPQGHDFLGKAQQIVMMLAAVFIRPVCIIIGFVLAIFIFKAASSLLDMVYFPFVKKYASGLLMSSPGMSLAVIMMMIIYGYLVLSIVRHCFSLTYILPSYVVRWIGLAPISGGEEEAIESAESSMKEALSSGLQGASTGVSAMR